MEKVGRRTREGKERTRRIGKRSDGGLERKEMRGEEKEGDTIALMVSSTALLNTDILMHRGASLLNI